MAGLRELALWLLDRRRLVVLTVLVGWAVVIGAGAGADPAESGWLGLPALGDLLVLVVGVMAVVGLVLFVALLASMRRSDTELPARRPLWPSLAVMILLLLVALRLPRPERSDRRAEPPAPEADGQLGPTFRDVVVGSEELVVLLAVVALALAAMIWSRRRLRALHEQGTNRPLIAELDPILDGVTQRLQRTVIDPRSAVIDAYASLEESLEGLGHGRRRSETPSEHVGRILSGLSIDPAPVVALAQLYEVARFSDHPVTVDDQQRAVIALRAVRDRLSAASPSAAAAGPLAAGPSAVGDASE